MLEKVFIIWVNLKIGKGEGKKSKRDFLACFWTFEQGGIGALLWSRRSTVAEPWNSLSSLMLPFMDLLWFDKFGHRWCTDLVLRTCSMLHPNHQNLRIQIRPAVKLSCFFLFLDQWKNTTIPLHIISDCGAFVLLLNIIWTLCCYSNNNIRRIF